MNGSRRSIRIPSLPGTTSPCASQKAAPDGAQWGVFPTLAPEIGDSQATMTYNVHVDCFSPAQVSGVVHEGAEFKADTHTLLLDEYGICQWSDEKPPTKLAVVTKSVTVELPGLTWKAKLPKRPRKNS